MHQAKALGRIAEAIEPCDHGEGIDEEKLRLAVRNFFINTLRLAEMCGITGEDLAHMVEDFE